MKTQIDSIQWGSRSVSWWLTLILAAGIIFIGVRFIVTPSIGAYGYGIGFSNNNDSVYGKIKGIRDIFSGIVILPLALMHMRKAAAWVFTMTIIVPATDFIIILYTNGPKDIAHLMIHGSTVLVMIVTSVLLFQHSKVGSIKK